MNGWNIENVTSPKQGRSAITVPMEKLNHSPRDAVCHLEDMAMLGNLEGPQTYGFLGPTLRLLLPSNLLSMSGTTICQAHMPLSQAIGTHTHA